MRSPAIPVKLAAVLEKLGKIAVAFSGGVDSTLLAAAAGEVLGREAVLLLFADSVFAAARERAFACSWAAERGLALRPVPVAPLERPEIVRNGPERCYFCKKLLMGRLLETARGEGFAVLADGANLDDRLDYRPGARAAGELGVIHPLCEAEMDKEAIRAAARGLGLPNHDAPAAACLASRIPCGTPLAADALAAVDAGEELLAKFGFRGVRLRHYGALAKLEFAPDDLPRAFACRAELLSGLTRLGFRQVALDLAGYRRGAVNGAERLLQEKQPGLETLENREKQG